MIQRIQTIYLVLGIVSLLFLFFLDPVWQNVAAETFPWFNPVLLGLSALTIVLASFAIFMYKKREQQRKVVVSVQMTTVLLMLVLFGGLYYVRALTFLENEQFSTTRLLIILLPIISYIFFFLARRGIDKDIKLLRSVDRLR